jgi:hypothetical protein
MLVTLSVLPILSLIHFWDLFLGAHVLIKNPPSLVQSIWAWSALTSFNDPACVVESDISSMQTNLSCLGKITIFPGLEPAAFLVLTLAAMGATFLFWWFVFYKPATPSAISEDAGTLDN